MKKETAFYLAVGLQLAILLGIVAMKLSALSHGADVYLAIKPVDPHDILRGDYVRFQPEISTIPVYSFNYSPIRNGDTVYVPLEKSGKEWIAQYGVQKVHPDDRSKVYIRGTVADGDISGGVVATKNSGGTVWVDYGIGQYYIPEGKGRGFTFWGHEAFARVTVGANGEGIVRRLYVDGREWP